MLELCLDTSDGAAVAVVDNGEVLGRAREDSPRLHAELLTPLIVSACDAAGLHLDSSPWTRICVGTGPAPFTGLRAGLVTATVLGRTLGVPVYGVASLEIIARQALDVLPDRDQVIPVTDARRKEVYWGRYCSRGPHGLYVLHEPVVSHPEALLGELRSSDAVPVGPGVDLIDSEAPTGLTDPADPAVLSRLVNTYLDLGRELRVKPLYLRRPDVHGG